MPELSPRYALPEDLEFVPVSEADIEAADAEQSDIVIDRRGSRQHAKLISAEMAEMLKLFREPCRLTEAVAQFSRKNNLDPYAVLENALEPLLELANSGFLLPAGHAEPTEHRPRLAPDRDIAGLTLMNTLRATDDTEVYLASDRSGALRCLKTLGPQAGETQSAAFRREIAMARQLSGRTSPPVVDVLDHGGAPILVSEWIDGISADRALAQLRTHRPEDVPATLHRIAAAFAQIHADGILHGDIRASNVIIDWNGRVWIVDFGFAGYKSTDPQRLSFELATIEPEAAAVIAEGNVPELTEAGEQYGVALLIAELLTGTPQRIVPALRSDALLEISQAKPLDIPACPALTRATEQDPEKRFPSLLDFAEAIEPPKRRSNAGSQPVDLDLQSVEVAGALDRAYVQYQAAKSVLSPELLACSDQSIRIAEAGGFAPLEVASPLHTPMGGACLALEISLARADFESARVHVQNLETALQAPPGEAELFTGRAGYLALATQTYARSRPYDDAIESLDRAIRRLRNCVEDDLMDALSGLKARRQTHLGLAHGIAGLAYALVLGEESPPPCVKDALDIVASLAVPTPWGLAWPGTVHAQSDTPVTRDYSPSWCSGSAGYLALWHQASRHWPEEFAPLMDGAASHAARHPDATSNLCCGTAGRALILRRAGYVEYGAERLLGITLRSPTPAQEPSGSLFRGHVGTKLLTIPEAAFPI